MQQPPNPPNPPNPSHHPQEHRAQPHPSLTTPTSPTWPQQQQQMPTFATRPAQNPGVWQRFRGLSQRTQVLVAVGAAVVLLVCGCCSCGSFASLFNGNTTAQGTATTGSGGQTLGQGNQGNSTATATTGAATVAATATRSAPTATPKPAATATPKPKAPTATPKPACPYPAVNNNPWCYTFTNTGKVIYSPPGSFCNYFNCIKSFWTNTSGYVAQCNDGTFSHSGGVTGSCSVHGGEKRPLYAP